MADVGRCAVVRWAVLREGAVSVSLDDFEVDVGGSKPCCKAPEVEAFQVRPGEPSRHHQDQTFDLYIRCRACLALGMVRGARLKVAA